MPRDVSLYAEQRVVEVELESDPLAPLVLRDPRQVLVIIEGATELRIQRKGTAGLSHVLMRVPAGQVVFPVPLPGSLQLVAYLDPGTKYSLLARSFLEAEAGKSTEAARHFTSQVDFWLTALGRFCTPAVTATTEALGWKSANLTSDGRLSAAFDTAQRSAGRLLELLIAGQEDEAEKRVHLRAKSEAAHIAHTLASAGHLDTSGPGSDFASFDPLAVAFGRVASALGAAEPSRPGSSEVRDRDDAVWAMARRWDLRLRRVRLEGDWWCREGEPMVTFRMSDGAPVALLCAKRRFTAVMASGECWMLDAGKAAQLEPLAFLPQRGFDPGTVGKWTLFRFGIRNCGREIAALIAVSTLTVVAGLVTPYATGLAFENIIPAGARGELAQVVAGLIVVTLSVAAFEWVRGRTTIRLATILNTQTEAAVWDRLLRLPAAFFRQYTTGDLASRADAINQMRDRVGVTAVNVMLGGLFSVFTLALMLYCSWRLALIAVGVVTVEALVAIIISLRQIRLQHQQQSLAGSQSGLTVQLITGIDKLRSSAAEARAFAKWARGFGDLRWIDRRGRHLQSINSTFATSWGIVGTGAVMAGVGFGWAKLELGDFMAFSAAFGQFTAAVFALLGAIPSIISIVPLHARARPILEQALEPSNTLADPGPISGEVEVQSVTFRYMPNAAPALDRVSLLVRPGEFVALVGPSGSGKTTLLRLILGLERTETGGVFFDGHDIATLDPTALRRQIGTVLQNSRLFGGSIIENIAAGAPLSLEQGMEAARLAGFAEDILAMPMGLHTLVADGGGSLSGGQRQRLLISRAFARHPRLVLFDEATSALDNRAQAAVADTLQDMGVTRIIVAHRLSTVRFADRILVMRDGQIVEQGTFSELIDLNGLFAIMARRQMA